jgi:hypothetical protein
MKRFTITLAAALFMCAGISAMAAGGSGSTSTSTRPAYDPFAMKRAAEAPAGSAENVAFNRRQAIVTRLKNSARPPFHPGNRSPHQPGEPYHDRDGDGVEDHGGHGPPNQGPGPR